MRSAAPFARRFALVSNALTITVPSVAPEVALLARASEHRILAGSRSSGGDDVGAARLVTGECR